MVRLSCSGSGGGIYDTLASGKVRYNFAGHLTSRLGSEGVTRDSYRAKIRRRWSEVRFWEVKPPAICPDKSHYRRSRLPHRIAQTFGPTVLTSVRFRLG